MSIKNKLNRLKSHIVHQEKEPAQIEKKIQPSTAEMPYKQQWKEAGVKPYYLDDAFCLVREVYFPLDYQHGHYKFSDLIHAVSAWNRKEISHPLSSKGHKPNDLFFFDTETTGLGGGAGNTIFLLGHASLTESGVVLKQHILPNPGGEVALYKSFLESIDYTTMVTYNGKAFDWPQVKTRHTLIREHLPKLPPFGHFDLYHAARRMWKHRLERTKLSIVEKEVLGIERKDDIPGFLAPMIYFDFVESKNPEGMLGIMKHNEVDILSLISLYTHLSFQLLGLDQKQSERETFETGRWFAALGEREAAKEKFTKLSGGNSFDAYKGMHALAFEYKKQKEWLQAIPLWETVIAKGGLKEQLEASIELAKIYEHRQIDFNKAIFYTEKAENIFNGNLQLKRGNINLENIAKRKARLTKRINREEKIRHID
ncbi:ribonuclease H-like domain-containing protein [Cytobacillus horneckiae]|uniref:ribonuclease H-like domain-containing protein n=1 Tax=Cytobacillus horneckiae TaxID=549687 RepID=UPI0039A07B88